MKKYYLFSLLAIGAAGCMANNCLEYDSVSATNLYHIARVQKGMSEQQVLRIMHKPYQYESFEVGEDVYDVWFYVTRTTVLGQTRMVPQNLTPLTFKNGILVGTGYYWYYYAMKEHATEMAARTPQVPKPKTQEEEDREFEKALKPPAPPKQKPNPAPQAEAQASIVAKTPIAVGQKTFSKIRLGMTDADVRNILGSPIDDEAYEVNGESYRVWFYEVESKKKDHPTQTVPLTFKKGLLVGMTTKYYEKIQKADSQDETGGYTKEAEKMESQESEQNFDFW